MQITFDSYHAPTIRSLSPKLIVALITTYQQTQNNNNKEPHRLPSQFSPVQPSVHVHLYPFDSLVHVPPFAQGLLSHGSTGIIAAAHRTTHRVHFNRLRHSNYCAQCSENRLSVSFSPVRFTSDNCVPRENYVTDYYTPGVSHSWCRSIVKLL